MQSYQKLKQNQKNELSTLIRRFESVGPEVRRAQAILFVNDGVDHATITTMTGYSRKHAFTLRSRYVTEGISAIQDKRMGKRKELLTKKQRDAIVAVVKKTTPRKHGYNNDSWTTSILGAYIAKKYTVTYKSKTSVYLLFRDAKFTYHKPGRVYQKRDEDAVAAWKKTTQSRVARALRDSGTVVLVEDEMVLSTTTTFQKIWLPSGEYPKIAVSNDKKSRSVYGFLNPRTGKEHAFKTAWQNMYITADILRTLRTIYPGKTILLVWDKAPWHKGSVAQQAIRDDGNIEIIEFPRAAPEENPQEHVWKAGRSHVTHNRFLDDIDTATDEFVTYLNANTFHYSFLGIKNEASAIS